MTVDVHDDTHRGSRHGEKRDGQTRPLHKRHIPFASLFIVTFAVVPLMETASWGVRHWDEQTGNLVAAGWMSTGALVSVIAIGIGALVRKRTTFMVVHVAATSFLWGAASMFTTLNGWSKVWAVIHFFGSMIVALSWSLYRIDVFRAAATGQSTDGWASFIGLARSRPRKVAFTDTHATIEVSHGPGETMQDVVSAARKLESAVGAIAGGTTTIPGERADTTLMSFEMADAFADWRMFPGPSHPGQTFALPFRTSYYATGKPQWFSFASSRPSPITDFRTDTETFMGLVGVTGGGKSGDLNNVAAEALTRTDVVVCWLDKEKFLQNAGWCADMLTMGGNEDNARDFAKALRELARFRVARFGQAALDAVIEPGASDIGRKWTPELAAELGEPAVLAIIDEADKTIHSDTWQWLSTRGRSLGIFICAATPRASAAEVPAVFRGSIRAWKTFAVGDNYSGGFTLSQETIDAGADPGKFREVGMHYLDRAPGVDLRLYPVKARTFQSSTRMLREMVLQARRVFTPMPLSPESIEAMGDFYQRCRPDVVLKLHTPDDAAAVAAQATEVDLEKTQRITAAQTARPAVAPDGDDEGEEEMGSSATGTDVDADEVATMDLRAAGIVDDDLARELAAVDPHKPIDVRVQGEPVRFSDDLDRPRLSDEATQAEMDRAISAFAAAGRMWFTNQELMEAMRCDFGAVTCSRRLSGLAETERIVPPGLQIEKARNGVWHIIRSQPSPAPRRQES
jgi:hypothetical protein